jgi:molybdopterin biosynthesis enzyme
MKLVMQDIEQAVGGVLVHNIADKQGHKALAKGHRLTSDDVDKLRALGKQQVFVGIFEEGDVNENDAATRIARAVAGENLTFSSVSGGRVNLLASTRGVLEINADALAEINMLDGVTVATVPAHAVVESKRMVATIKTVGLAIPEQSLRVVERVAATIGASIRVRAIPPVRAAVILTGGHEARERLEKGLLPPIHGRIEDLGGRVIFESYVEHEVDAIAQAIRAAVASGADFVMLAGETSIMDERDVTPSGIRRAGGVIEVYGAPVEPGNLLLLGYAEDLPILGAPGCVKSRDTNVVDLILPRLFAGERVSKRDIVALANGGLLI